MGYGLIKPVFRPEVMSTGQGWTFNQDRGQRFSSFAGIRTRFRAWNPYPDRLTITVASRTQPITVNSLIISRCDVSIPNANCINIENGNDRN